MCIINIAPAGTNKKSDFFLSAVESGMYGNTDGTGVALWRASNHITEFKKGFFVKNDVLDYIQSLIIAPEDVLLVHSRIGTSGGRNSVNTHPFLISDTQGEILKMEGLTKLPVIVHNGIFSKFSHHKSDYSDTYHFVKEFVCVPELLALVKRDPVLFHLLFEDIMSWSKLAFLFPDVGLVTVGTFLNDEGYMFSNGGYKNKFLRNVGGKESYVSNKVITINNKEAFNTRFTDSEATEEDVKVENKAENLKARDNSLNYYGIEVTKENFGEFLFEFSGGIVGTEVKEGEIYLLGNTFDPSTDMCTVYKAGTKAVMVDNVMTSTVFPESAAIHIPMTSVTLFSNLLPHPKYSEKWKDFSKIVAKSSYTKKCIKRLQAADRMYKKGEPDKTYIKGIPDLVLKSAVKEALQHVQNTYSTLSGGVGISKLSACAF